MQGWDSGNEPGLGVAFAPIVDGVDPHKAYITVPTGVVVVDTIADTQLGMVDLFTGWPTVCVAFSQDGTKAYTTDTNNPSSMSVIKSTAVPVKITSPASGSTVPIGSSLVVSGTGEPGMTVHVVLAYNGVRRSLGTTVQHDSTWSVNAGTPRAAVRMNALATQSLGNLPVSEAKSSFSIG